MFFSGNNKLSYKLNLALNPKINYSTHFVVLFARFVCYLTVYFMVLYLNLLGDLHVTVE